MAAGKRALVLAIVLSLIVPAANATVAAPQEESGTILFPTPHPQDPSICFQGVGRRINMVSQGVVSGPFGVIFDVDKATWKGKFKLDITGGATGREDIDLYFFSTFGEIADDPSMNSPTILTQYQERNTKGEAGVIPPESTKAIACLWDGFGASFDYEGTPPVKKKKKKKKK
ncbi:MAG: hypothetical protein ACRDJ5_00495 [Actinomycetota bacterium]